MKNKSYHNYTILAIIIFIIASTVLICYSAFANQNNINDGSFINYLNQVGIASLRSTDNIPAGMNRVILEKHYIGEAKDNSNPVLKQSDFLYENTIYVIKYDFLLKEEIVIPKNSILEFEGGSLRGGILIGNGASIKAADYAILNDCILNNFTLSYVDPRWVGAVSDFDEQKRTGTDNSRFFQMAYDNIIKNHPGTALLINGKYLISKTVVFGMQCHLKGYHNNTRGAVINGQATDKGSSNSLIAVGDCPAFKVVGNGKETATWADFSIEHIKFLGLDKNKSIAIQYEASGSPSRPAFIEKCEACNLLYFFYTIAINNSTIGNLTIKDNNIYQCGKAIYAVSNPAHKMGFTSLKIENNVIEHNGDKCIHLNRCFGPIIIDNNILEGESNPIYLASTYPAETNYVIKNNYFEYSKDDDKKIQIEGVVDNQNGYKHVLFHTSTEIYGNTSAFSFTVALNGVVIKRLDRIDTPAKSDKNYSIFTRCLFDDIDISDTYVTQFDEWNFTTLYPTSSINRNNALIGESGDNMLTFDDCKGNAHSTSSTVPHISTTRGRGNSTSFIIVKMRPQLSKQHKETIIRHQTNNQKTDLGVDFPRELPYYAFRAINNSSFSLNSNVDISFSAFNDTAKNIEVSNITVYNNANDRIFKYPHILLPYMNETQKSYY